MIATSKEITLLQEDIDQLLNENIQNTTQIKLGSDEHLDILLIAKNLMQESVIRINRLNNKLYTELNKIDNKTLQENILPKLEQYSKSCLDLISIAKHECFCNVNSEPLSQYIDGVELLNEVISDIKNYRLADLSELDSILK